MTDDKKLEEILKKMKSESVEDVETDAGFYEMVDLEIANHHVIDSWKKSQTQTATQILNIMEKKYQKRREHRANCKHWAKFELCLSCGFGISRFIKDVEKEYLGENK